MANVPTWCTVNVQSFSKMSDNGRRYSETQEGCGGRSGKLEQARPPILRELHMPAYGDDESEFPITFQIVNDELCDVLNKRYPNGEIPRNIANSLVVFLGNQASYVAEGKASLEEANQWGSEFAQTLADNRIG